MGEPEFGDLGDWEVTALRNGEVAVAGLFRQSYPEDVVCLLLAVVRAKFSVRVDQWGPWNFQCVCFAPEAETRTVLFGVGPRGTPVRLADSGLTGFAQHAPNVSM